MIIIFSAKYDYSSSLVMDRLKAKGENVIRINRDENTYQFEQLTENGIYFRNIYTEEIINLDDVTSCWWRRGGFSMSQFYEKSNKISEIKNDINVDLTPLYKEKSIIKNEFESLINYIRFRVYNKSRINLGSPIFNLNRLEILDLAKKYGLHTPKYNVITSGKQLSENHKYLGNAVSKALSDGIYDEIESYRFYTYTELIDSNFYEDNAETIFFPSLITSLVEKQIEIRSFYIDGDFFSMAIFSQSDEQTKIDFRKYSSNRNEPYKLPSDVEEKLRMLFEKINLNTGSADLILDKNGNYIFLEINPVGQYGMTSEPCNYDLDNLITNYLINGRIRNN